AVRTQMLDATGNYKFDSVPNGVYQVFAGADENGDGLVGLPGRPWGAYESAISVFGGGNYFGGNVSVSVPYGKAVPLVVRGYVQGALTTTFDRYKVQVPAAGTYTFETSASDGTCGFAIESNTWLRL